MKNWKTLRKVLLDRSAKIPRGYTNFIEKLLDLYEVKNKNLVANTFVEATRDITLYYKNLVLSIRITEEMNHSKLFPLQSVVPVLDDYLRYALLLTTSNINAFCLEVSANSKIMWYIGDNITFELIPEFTLKRYTNAYQFQAPTIQGLVKQDCVEWAKDIITTTSQVIKKANSVEVRGVSKLVSISLGKLFITVSGG